MSDSYIIWLDMLDNSDDPVWVCVIERQQPLGIYTYAMSIWQEKKSQSYGFEVVCEPDDTDQPQC